MKKMEEKFNDIRMLLTDSRNHFKGDDTLFFAIKTPGGNDGHRYMKELYDRGVRNFVAEYIPEEFVEGKKVYKTEKDIVFGETSFKEVKVGDAKVYLVEETLHALGEIGSRHRKNAEEIVAIIGSRGKTTIKEMLYQLLEKDRSISRSPRSYNSKIGVPLSLWQIAPHTELALIEAGISKKGEMKRLAEIVNPDVVIFTNIGDAHSQGFESIQEKAKEKAVMAYAPNVRRVIYSQDYNVIEKALEHLPENVERISWSSKNVEADLYITPDTEGRVNGITENSSPYNILNYKWKGDWGKLPVAIEKEYDLENIAGALAFMLSEGYSQKYIEERFGSYHRINTRLNVSEGINGCSVILDSYTSDLSSLLPAIDFMSRRKMPRQSITLILSDLRHEVTNIDETYQRIAKLVEETGVKRFIGVGKTMRRYANLFPSNSQFYEDTSAFLKELRASDFSDEIILLKGAPGYGFEKIFEELEARKHETVLEVNLDAMLRNYNYFRSFLPESTGIVAMVKASGYGAGSYEIAKTLQDAGAAYLAVAALDEGVDLRNKGIVMPIMVMNPRSANYETLFRHRLEPVVYNLSMLRDFITASERFATREYPVHIKLDTGMHRMGFESHELIDLKNLLKSSSKVKVASIFSHLATADCIDMDTFTYRQLQRFEELSTELMSGLGYQTKRHILNSAGIIRFPEYHYDMVRLGIGLYGANTLPADIEKPLSVVSTLRTVIICIREIEGDEAVGYGRRGKIKGKTSIATLPIGYADGMNRKFGNGAIKVMVNGKLAPTIGNICMDATMIDVTGIDCKEGDSVEIFGENIPLQNLSDTLDTIPYEVLTSVSPRVKRVYYRE